MKLINVIIGCFIASIGILVLNNSHIITGGTAGLALSLSYLLNMPFSAMFFVVNIPFYILSIMKMGWKFTLSTLFAVTSLSVISGIEQQLYQFTVPAWLGALLGGGVLGSGLAYLFLNGSSLGGNNILALFFQKRFGWDPGKVSFIFDFAVILSGIYSIGLKNGLYSILSILIISSIISIFKGKIAVKHTKIYQNNSIISNGLSQK